ncbi:hypothetical protein R69746_08265 [Paraburkholderia aspalathi]|uniref:hypothetical protein n=1 Tax=Paraburkholderia aspalathi TaxID=1324617 RepID=UPI00190C5DAD|nr:hypothetical protein [Paraburkholderia aspalathi]MBK3844187.1 hypothetical protein [Paraburkholderia aspalathi]CAE6868668.1 hypothetical protein R69746_08265 [Paraburkholderia aspalathi]
MRIIIVDDNREHGTAIKRALSLGGFTAEFFHFDERDIGKLPDSGGIRIVFCDLNLSGDGVGGTKDYATVGAVLEQIIAAENGPYALVSWTTFAEAAGGLGEYIKERLPAYCHPIDFKIIDKEQLVAPAAAEALRTAVLDVFSSFPAIRAALEWESAVTQATWSIFKRLEDIAGVEGPERFDKRLHQIFTKLAEAEGGTNALNRGDITHPLSIVLGRLLYDELTRISISAMAAENDQNFDNFETKKARLNAMLHVHEPAPAAGLGGSLPGLVFPWPEDGVVSGIPDTQDRAAFIKAQFLRQNTTPEQIAQCRLVLVDVTPTCDHSQNRIAWRRFIGAILVPRALRATLESANGAGRLSGLPAMEVIGQDYILAFNSQLSSAVQNGEPNLRLLGAPLFQLREQIYSDTLGWIGRQASRIGYTSFDARG